MQQYTSKRQFEFLKSLFSCSSPFKGQVVTGLVREFMEFFELDFSLAVFDPETGFVSKTTVITVVTVV